MGGTPVRGDIPVYVYTLLHRPRFVNASRLSWLRRGVKEPPDSCEVTLTAQLIALRLARVTTIPQIGAYGFEIARPSNEMDAPSRGRRHPLLSWPAPYAPRPSRNLRTISAAILPLESIGS